jgi:hypothetical protein
VFAWNKSTRRYDPADQHRHMDDLDLDGTVLDLKYGVTVGLGLTGAG